MNLESCSVFDHDVYLLTLQVGMFPSDRRHGYVLASPGSRSPLTKADAAHASINSAPARLILAKSIVNYKRVTDCCLRKIDLKSLLAVLYNGAQSNADNTQSQETFTTNRAD